jgi:trimethylamine--corrinoid protein Co-methyltransferase
MGHHAGFLSHPHTRKWYREEFYFPSEVIDRGSYDEWENEGSKSINERASERVNQILASYEPPEIAKEVLSEIQKIAEREAKKLGITTIHTSIRQ